MKELLDLSSFGDVLNAPAGGIRFTSALFRGMLAVELPKARGSVVSHTIVSYMVVVVNTVKLIIISSSPLPLTGKKSFWKFSGSPQSRHAAEVRTCCSSTMGVMVPSAGMTGLEVPNGEVWTWSST